MIDPRLDDGERVIGRVFIYRIADTEGGMRDDVLTDDGDGGGLDLPTAVGMLAIAQHTLLSGEISS